MVPVVHCIGSKLFTCELNLTEPESVYYEPDKTDTHTHAHSDEIIAFASAAPTVDRGSPSCLFETVSNSLAMQ